MSLRVLHTADLHLSRDESAYSLEVLAELVYHCRRLEAQAWVLSGDIFDKPADAEALADDVVSHLKELGGLPVAMIPGNHELAGGAAPPSLSALAGRLAPSVRLILDEPFGVWQPGVPGLEILGVPFRRQYDDFPDWKPPAKTQRWRVGMLHGVVNGLTYTGESEEEDHGVIDPHLFTTLDLDYAALGHIHAGREAAMGSCLVHYPGSARVWRRGETGPRHSTLVVLGEAGVVTKPVLLEAAGAYRDVQVSLDETGDLLEFESAEALLSALAEEHNSQDWLRVVLTGFVEGMEPVEALQRTTQRMGAGRFRKFQVETEVVEAEGLRGHPLVRAFNGAWAPRLEAARAHGDVRETEVLMRARRQVLKEIHLKLVEN